VSELKEFVYHSAAEEIFATAKNGKLGHKLPNFSDQLCKIVALQKAKQPPRIDLYGDLPRTQPQR
jgi:hypothetical protein